MNTINIPQGEVKYIHVMPINQDPGNYINLKNLIAVSGIRWNSDGIFNSNSFKLIFPCMVVIVKQEIRLSEDTMGQGAIFPYISQVRANAIRSLKGWRRLFPTPLNISGLFISCYIPQHRKNGC